MLGPGHSLNDFAYLVHLVNQEAAEAQCIAVESHLRMASLFIWVLRLGCGHRVLKKVGQPCVPALVDSPAHQAAFR